jgi:hypothetical protein
MRMPENVSSPSGANTTGSAASGNAISSPRRGPAEFVKDAGAMMTHRRLHPGAARATATPLATLSIPSSSIRRLCTPPAAVAVRGAPARMAIRISTLMPRRAAAR